VPPGSALDRAGLAERPELVADVQDLAALGGVERDVVQARPVAAGQCDVVHGRLAEHPGRVQRAVATADVLRRPEPEPRHGRLAAGHVRGDHVEVVQPGDRPGAVQVEALGQPLNVVTVVEVLDREAERVLHRDGLTQPAARPGRPPPHRAAQVAVVRLRRVQFNRRADPVAESGQGRHRPLAQHQRMMQVLLETPQVDGGAVLLGDDQAQDTGIELRGRGQVGHHQLGVGGADDVRGGRAGRGRLVAHRDLPRAEQ
jgi:hypothetical protein